MGDQTSIYFNPWDPEFRNNPYPHADTAGRGKTLDALTDYFSHEIERRRRTPRPDLVSALVRAHKKCFRQPTC